MVCMSPRVTSSLIDKITEDYDAKVVEWAHELERCIEVSTICVRSVIKDCYRKVTSPVQLFFMKKGLKILRDLRIVMTSVTQMLSH